MSSEYFGLIMDPFERGPDTRFLYMEPARRNAFAQLMSSVYECRGLVLLACARGLGKSTLVRHLAEQLSALDSVLVLYPGGVLNCRPGMSFSDILAACRGRFDRRDPSAADEERLMTTIERAAGRSQVVVLMLDDADALDDDALLRLRRLCEADDDDRRLLTVVLVGSPKLAQRLDQLDGYTHADLFVELMPLRDRDVDRLVRHRLAVAGHADGNLFSPVALAEVARRARGNPMRINVLCQAALSLAEREMKSTVSRDLVERAAAAVEMPGDDDGADVLGHREAARPPAGLPREPAPGARPTVEPNPPAAHHDETARRLDDVAEAIRAADRRSLGGTDPHIKYAFNREPSGVDALAPEPERGEPPHAAGRMPAEPPSYADEHRFYPGVRPSEPPRQSRRGWLATTLLLGLLLVLIIAGGLYGARSGLFDFGELAGRAGSMAGKLGHLVSEAIRPDPVVEEASPGGLAAPGADASAVQPGPAPDAAASPRSTSLGFDRFGTPANDNEKAKVAEAPPVERYEYAPPPPQAPRQADLNAAPSSSAAPPEPEQRTVSSAASAGLAGTSDAGNDPGLDPGTASILSRAGPPEMSKPSPPRQPEPHAAGSSAGSSAPPPSVATPAPQQPAPQQPAPQPAAPEPQSSATAALPAAPQTTRSEGRTESRQAQSEPLLARGDDYLVTADLDMARTFYQMAYERGSAEAAVRMGWTFDPQYFQRAGVRGEASPREAILWYQEALRRGSRQASERLSALATWLQSAAASGDQEAQRILRLWQG